MNFRRLVLLYAALATMLVLSACSGSSIFVGVEATGRQPNYTIVDNVASGPLPPVGPQALRPGSASEQAEESVADRPILPAANGPAFNWQETTNILLLGTDRRSGADNWRTDTIMVVGLDQARNRAAVLSIPRDLYIDIPGYGQGRINQVDYIGDRVLRVDGGGPALVSRVLSDTLGLATEHWVRVEMTGFQSVVDAVGGVTVHLDCPFYEPIYNLDTNAWDYFVLPAGPNHLDGESAYWFVRLRLRESDIGRSQRQRQFLWAMREQFLSSNLVVRIPELWAAFSETFTTDLSLLDMIRLAQYGVGLEPGNVRSAGITLRELSSYTTASGASVLVIQDPARVQAVVEGIWDAPAMVDTNRDNPERCAEVPEVGPWLPAQGGQTDAVTPATGDAGAALLPEAGEAADLAAQEGG